jgi:hypothetical protein
MLETGSVSTIKHKKRFIEYGQLKAMSMENWVEGGEEGVE